MLLEDLLPDGCETLAFNGEFEDGQALYRQACARGLGEIVSKRRDDRYRSGPFEARRSPVPGCAF